MPGPAGPDEQTLVRAWKLRALDGLTIPQLAEELGSSITTVKRWVRDGRELVAQLEYSDTLRTQLKRADLQEDAAAVMDMVRGWMVEQYNNGMDPFKCADIVIRAEERKARLLGESQRIDLRAGPALPPVADDDTQRAIEGYRNGAR